MATTREETEEYLGDGLYASFSGYDIKLRAPQMDGTEMAVYLDLYVLAAFLKYAYKYMAVSSPGAPNAQGDEPQQP
jgi:hypothetical protein